MFANAIYGCFFELNETIEPFLLLFDSWFQMSNDNRNLFYWHNKTSKLFCFSTKTTPSVISLITSLFPPGITVSPVQKKITQPDTTIAFYSRNLILNFLSFPLSSQLKHAIVFFSLLVLRHADSSIAARFFCGKKPLLNVFILFDFLFAHSNAAAASFN